jgi:sugar/nucleoside kinase (ribokinase family)
MGNASKRFSFEPSRGSLTLVEEIGFHIGGAVPNTGAVLARLGVPISVVGRIGNDQFGSFVRQQLEKWAHTAPTMEFSVLRTSIETLRVQAAEKALALTTLMEILN